MLTFLQPGATAIVMNYWLPQANTSTQMEALCMPRHGPRCDMHAASHPAEHVPGSHAGRQCMRLRLHAAQPPAELSPTACLADQLLGVRRIARSSTSCMSPLTRSCVQTTGTWSTWTWTTLRCCLRTMRAPATGPCARRAPMTPTMQSRCMQAHEPWRGDAVFASCMGRSTQRACAAMSHREHCVQTPALQSASMPCMPLRLRVALSHACLPAASTCAIVGQQELWGSLHIAAQTAWRPRT